MRIQHVSEKEVILHFPGREPFTLYSASGRVAEMLDEFLCPVDQSNFVRLSDYQRAVEQSEEPTLVIEPETDWTLTLEYANLCM